VSKERLASGTIWSKGRYIIPMCDVQHIERRPIPSSADPHKVQIVVVMKSTRLDNSGDWDNAIWLQEDLGEQFIQDYCYFRSEIDPVRVGP
jgi:hypothetical protein